MGVKQTRLFEVEWLGGVAEHQFRRVRPLPTDIAWDTLDKRRYRPEAIGCAQQVWTDLALSEYAAIASFAEVVRALVEAQAPLDLIGMTSDFLADEVRHVELACRVVMQLGGAAPRRFEPARLVPSVDVSLSPLARANELALRVGSIAESFASATAVPIMRAATHPVIRAVYETILRDEARHCRFASLYFEWASEHWDEAERVRLATVARESLHGLILRSRKASTLRSGGAPAARPVRDDEALELGWFEPVRYEPLVRSAVLDDLVPQLLALGLPLDIAAVTGFFSSR
jgi:hypothetical protein